jgi:hypothetical protein
MGVPWFFSWFFYPIGIPRFKYTSCFSRGVFFVFHRNPAIGIPTGDDISTVSWAGFRPFLFSTPDIFLWVKPPSKLGFNDFQYRLCGHIYICNYI